LAGVSRSSVGDWHAAGRLHRRHRGVYALGHRNLTDRGRCIEALLYAGAGAVLSHLTAAWAWDLVEELPPIIDVTTRRRIAPSEGLRIHQRRDTERVRREGLPVTLVPRTLLDCAAVLDPKHVAALLREADYQRRLDAQAALALCGRGRAGSAALRRALELHLPELARANGEFEARFAPLVRRAGLPPGRLNARVAGMVVDVVWFEKRLIVELDGVAAHATPAGLRRDRDRELRLRAAGFRVVRYTWHQITRQPDLVVADLQRLWNDTSY
jgi:very-short-patch-repair endonuclease